MAQNISIKKLIMLTGDLPPMPYVARRVMEVVNDPSTNASSLQDVISKDQGLASQILKIANSALYACSRKIDTLTDAIVMLGFNAIKSLSIMSATKNLYNFTRRGKVLGLKDKLMWEHSVGAALAARMIARDIDALYMERAFMGGLLHDIGKLVLLQKVPRIFDSIVEEVYNSGKHFSVVETENLGFTHAEVGARLLGKWKLSEELEIAVKFHHNITPDLKMESRLVYIIDLANKLCHKLGIGFMNEPNMDLSEDISSLMLNLSEKRLTELESSIKFTLKQELNVFL